MTVDELTLSILIDGFNTKYNKKFQISLNATQQIPNFIALTQCVYKLPSLWTDRECKSVFLTLHVSQFGNPFLKKLRCYFYLALYTIR